MIINNVLKKKILDNAIHGSLVKNDNTLKPVNIDSANTDIPFEVPYNWKWCYIKSVAKCKTGNSINETEKRKNYSNMDCDGLFYIGTKDIEQNNYINYTNGIKIPNESISKFKIAKKDSSLICIEGGSAGKKVGFVNQDVCYVNKLCNIYSEVINNKYIYYFLQSTFFINEFDSKKNGIIGGVSVKNFEQLLIPIPPLEEQKRIVEEIDVLLDLIDKKEKNDKEKDRLKNALKEKILENAIHGTLIKNNDMLEPLNVEEIKNEVPFDIPSNWKWTFSKCITSNIQYGFTATSDDKGNCQMLRITDIQDNNVNWERVPKCIVPLNDIEKYCLHQNDIVVARTGGTVGKNFLISSILDNCVFASYLIRLVPNEKINSLYLKYYMDSNFYWKQIADKSKGMAQANVNGKSLSMLKIPLPPLEEQNRIVEKIESLFELIEQL